MQSVLPSQILCLNFHVKGNSVLLPNKLVRRLCLMQIPLQPEPPLGSRLWFHSPGGTSQLHNPAAAGPQHILGRCSSNSTCSRCLVICGRKKERKEERQKGGRKGRQEKKKGRRKGTRSLSILVSPGVTWNPLSFLPPTLPLKQMYHSFGLF